MVLSSPLVPNRGSLEANVSVDPSNTWMLPVHTLQTGPGHVNPDRVTRFVTFMTTVVTSQHAASKGASAIYSLVVHPPNRLDVIWEIQMGNYYIPVAKSMRGATSDSGLYRGLLNHSEASFL
ncbi:hypothetical protein BM1_06092 [Bipolaris maydis]|nr:hypothetical protein BM1_06092 [Bipolaris maydis]